MQFEDFKRNVFPLKDKLYRFALVIMKHREDAEDVVQEVLLKLWSMREKLHQYNSLEAYAMQMTKNTSLNKLNAKERRWVDIDHLESKHAAVAPDQSLEKRESHGVLLKLIDNLPPQQRWVILLRDIEGMEMEEISSVTEMTENNIRVSLSLARKRLIQLYASYYGYEGKRP